MNVHLPAHVIAARRRSLKRNKDRRTVRAIAAELEADHSCASEPRRRGLALEAATSPPGPDRSSQHIRSALAIEGRISGCFAKTIARNHRVAPRPHMPAIRK